MTLKETILNAIGYNPSTETEEKRTYTNNSIWGGSSSYSGVAVSPETAMTLSAVYSAVKIISETLASLPLLTYAREERGKRRAIELSLYYLLHDAPNELMTSFEFRELQQQRLLLHGNALAEIAYNGRGGVESVWPLDPLKVKEYSISNGKVYYHYERPDHSNEWISSDNIWHIRGMGGNGVWGYSPIHIMRNSLGVQMATEEYAGKFFASGAQPSGVLKHPGALGDTAYDRIKDSWAETHGGLENAHKTAILEEGMEYQQISLPPEDAQFLQTRQFGISDVARMYNIPLHMLNELSRSTNNNIENQSLGYVIYTVRPWLVRWEQSMQKNLFLSSQRGKYFAEFLVDGLLRGDTKTRHDTYAIGRQNGYYSANDVREMENKNPIDDGDIYLVPLNMTPADQIGEDTEQPTDTGARSLIQPETVETRAQRSVGSRSQLITEFEPMFAEVLQRSVRREVSDVKRQAKKTIGKDNTQSFIDWMPGYYEDHRAYMDKSLRPIFAAYMAATIRAIKNEMQSQDDITLVDFTKAYLDTYTNRYSQKQQKYILAEIERAQAEDGDVLLAVDNLMDYYDEDRATQESERETRRMGNAIALASYGAVGVTVKRWQTVSDNCPYCNQLKGRTIEINEYFLDKGDAVTAAGVSPLPITANIGHPPAHDGCDCMVVAG